MSHDRNHRLHPVPSSSTAAPAPVIPSAPAKQTAASSLSDLPYPPVRQGHSSGLAIFLTGLPGAGKTSIARELGSRMAAAGYRVTMLDGDDLRSRVSPDLGYSRSDREANLRRAGIIASEVVKHGGIAICSFIAPYEHSRQEIRTMVNEHGTFFLVHVATPIEECERRDPKGLYRKARAGEVANFTGISDIYETPAQCDLVIDTTGVITQDSADKVLRGLAAKSLVAGVWVAAGLQQSHNQIAAVNQNGNPQAGNRVAFLFQRILRAIADRRVSLRQLAQQLAVERHSIEKAVRVTTGHSFRQLQRTVLFERANLLLAQGRPIKEIAFDLGFGSPQSFHRFIRSTSGKTPAALRQSA